MSSLFSFYIFFLASAKKNFFFSSFYSLDSYSIFMLSIFPLIFLLIYSNPLWKGPVLKLYLLIFFFLSLCFLSENMFFFLLGLESCVFFMLKLMFNFSKDLDKISSSFFMFFFNIIGSIPFMFFVCPVSLNLCCWVSSSPYSFFFLSSEILFFCFMLILLTKIPVFFTHFWLTKAHVSASGTTSMLLASLMLKIGTFGIFKFVLNFKFISMKTLNLFISLGLFGSLMVIFVMMRFFDMKYLVACSSILHMSLIAPLLLSLSTSGAVSSMLMMMGHGLVSYFLFFLVSLVYENSFNRSIDFNKSLESSSKSLNFWFFMFFTMNLGFPPLINFLSEFLSCYFFFFYSFIMLVIFSVILFLSIFFFMFFITKIFFGKKLFFNFNFQDYFLNLMSISFMSFLIFLPLMFF